MLHESNKYISIVSIGILLLSTFLLFPNDISGWLLFYSLFGLLFTLAPAQKVGPQTFAALFFVIIVHQIISISNAYEITYFFLQPDSINFQNYAKELALSSPFQIFLFHSKYDFYARFLALFYLMSSSQLFGQELSILAFFLGCLVLIKITKLLNPKKNIPLLLLLYGIFPSFLFYDSIIIREPWETLFLFLALYHGILLITALAFSVKNAFYLFLFSVGMGLFHKGLLPCAMLFLAYFYLYSFIKFFLAQKSHRFFWMITLVTFFTTTSLIVFVFYYGPYFIFKISHYRTGVMHFKGHFNYEVPLSPIFSLNWIYEVFKAYIYYLAGPFTIKDPAGLLLFTIAKLRIVAILIAVFFYKPTHVQEKITFHTLLFAYFMVSLIFSLGVSNYVTGLRHHMLTDWILMVLLIPSHCLNKPFSHFMSRRIAQ